MAEETKVKAVKPKMVRADVLRSNIAKAQSQGWTPVKCADSPDGRMWNRDTLLMEIEEGKLAELDRERRASYEPLSELVRRGKLPVAANTAASGATLAMQAEDIKDASNVGAVPGRRVQAQGGE